ncbi:septum formation family protein [Arthrobacter sp. Leaf234]|uniref:septum formation family protein n=1 Tax=Arthrobacter sp. Leaf234 TaxID=1736303 RepID=UPI0012FABF36|nr:septum formation family protein [Arthrobacter sp. Leaf234]
MRTGNISGTDERRSAGSVRRRAVAASLLALMASSGCSLLPTPEPDRDAQGTVTAEAGTDALPIAVGDCIDDPGMTDVSDITVLPCAEPHTFEAFATTTMPDGDYPGEAAANTAAGEFCAGEFTGFVGVEHDASVLELLVFYPVEERWDTEADRRILCFVAEAGETPVTGSLENAGR